MLELPADVVRNIALKYHPVVAWRNFYGLSQKKFASLCDMSIEQLEKIESTNLHLRDDVLSILSHALNIKEEALKIPYRISREHKIGSFVHLFHC